MELLFVLLFPLILLFVFILTFFFLLPKCQLEKAARGEVPQTVVPAIPAFVASNEIQVPENSLKSLQISAMPTQVACKL